MGKAGQKLKAALQSQQSRLKAKQKISHAAQVAEQVAEQKASRNKGQLSRSGKGKNKLPLSRSPTIPFHPTDKILLIGEGSFSFARSLVEDPPAALQYLPPRNITATAYDTEEECYLKYPEAESIISFLRTKDVEVLFKVDGTRLEKHSKLKGRRWNRIVWNFPHAGKGITDQDRNILSNQLLILDFLRSAAKMLQLGPPPSVSLSSKKKKKSDDDDDDEEDEAVSSEPFRMGTTEELQLPVSSDTSGPRGTILITLRNVAPYTQWDLPRLAKNPPPPKSSTSSPNPAYTLLRSFRFHRDIWKGYEHRMTKGERAHGKGTTGQGGEDRCWEFCLRDE